MKKSSIKENPLQIRLISWKIHSKLVSTILEFFFPKVVCKSMDDMGIGEIVSEVLFGPNVLERFPVWQVSSLKKKFWIFLCVLCYRNWEVQPLTKSFIISNTFFSMKKWKISKSVCDGIISRPVGMGFLFTKRFGWFPDIVSFKIFILKKFQIKLLWWWRHWKNWSSSSLSDSSPKEWNSQHMVMKHIR